MATITLTHRILLPSDGTPPEDVQVRLGIMASLTDPDAQAVAADHSIIGTVVATPDSLGDVTFTDVIANAELSPAHTRYTIDVYRRGDDRVWEAWGSTLHLTVKQSPPYAATQTVTSCIDPVFPAEMPPPVDSSGVLYQGSSNLAATQVEAAITELATQLAGNAEGATPQGQSLMEPIYDLLATGTLVGAVVADSIVEIARWPGEVERILAVRHPANGTLANRTSGGSIHASSWGTQGTAVSSENANGVAGYRLRIPAGTSIKHTFAEPVTGLGLFYETGSGLGTLTLQRAGVTVETQDTDGATGIGLLETDGHTLATVEWTIAAGVDGDVYVGVTHPYSGPIRLWQFSHPGFDLNEWSTLSNIFAGLELLDQDFTIISSGTNEGTAANVNTMYPAFVTTLRTNHGADHPIIATVPTAPLGVIATTRAVRTQCTTLGLGKIDFQAAIGDVSSLADPEDLSGDNVHPNEVGMQALANAAVMVLSGAPLDALAGMLTRQRAWSIRNVSNTATMDATCFGGTPDLTLATDSAEISASCSGTVPGVTISTDTSSISATCFTGNPSIDLTNSASRSAALNAATLSVQQTTGKAMFGDPFGVGSPGMGFYTASADTYPAAGMLGATGAALIGLSGGSAIFGPGGATLPPAAVGWDGTGIKITGRIRFGTPANTGWGSPTGTATRTTFVTGTVTLPQLAERVRAIIDDLKTCGLLGA